MKGQSAYAGTYNFDSVQSSGATPIGTVIGIFVFIASVVFSLMAGSFAYAILGFILMVLLASSIKVAAEWERVIILRMGRYSRMVGPGLFFIVPIFEQAFRTDIRVRVWDVQPQEIMSSDSVPVEVDAVVYYKIVDPIKAVIDVEDFAVASVKIAQTTLRDIVGKSDLDRLLTKKEEIGKDIQRIVDKATNPWGIRIIGVEIKDVILPEMLKRAMAKEAEASREKKARMIKADAEMESAKLFAKAAETIAKTPNALKLRQLQTWQEIGAEQNSLMILIPIEFASESGAMLGAAALGVKELEKMEKKENKK
ncbi:MAG: slipin family protein [Candidatus Micrarchaeota archaeon]|nr:slipin family protein [Candidatus Micrarchaeota archaeon]